MPEDASDKSVTWTSRDSSIACVDEFGLVIGRKGGQTVIVAEAGGISVNCMVTIQSDVMSILLDKYDLTLVEGESDTIIATVTPEDATDKTLLWVTTDESVATVNSEGQIIAVSQGCCEIYAIAITNNVRSRSCWLTVKQKGYDGGNPENFDNTELEW